MLTVGQLIKIGRINKKLGQEDVASKLKVSKNYISLVENGKKDPSINFLKGASDFLDIPPILLMWEKIDMPKGKTEGERKIASQLEKMLEEAQRLFSEKTFGKKKLKNQREQSFRGIIKELRNEVMKNPSLDPNENMEYFKITDGPGKKTSEIISAMREKFNMSAYNEEHIDDKALYIKSMKHLNPECPIVEIGTGNCPKCNPDKECSCNVGIPKVQKEFFICPKHGEQNKDKNHSDECACVCHVDSKSEILPPELSE